MDKRPEDSAGVQFVLSKVPLVELRTPSHEANQMHLLCDRGHMEIYGGVSHLGIDSLTAFSTRLHASQPWSHDICQVQNRYRISLIARRPGFH